MVNVPDKGRFEGRNADGELVGVTEYREVGDIYFFNHTEVEPAFEGQGVGSTVIKSALDEVRSQGKTIVPRCPFVFGFIQKHPEYEDIVTNRM